uniref:Uncharacterized protein n=1 Tax=viral metagenome TaxID=1070528 RepID=A0A6H1ZV53_9ZZZZ
MEEVLEACKKGREDMTNLSSRLLYTKWPTTAVNIVGNNAHYMIGKAIHALNGLISTLEAMGKEE